MAIPIADAGSDQTFAFSALPTSASLDGSASYDPDLGAITGYLWEILEKPAGSTAVLSSTTVVNPTLNNIDTEGTYMLFLVVTDDQAEDSDDNPLTAPESARVHINVRGPNAELIKPAPGERGWTAKYHEAIDEVESLRSDFEAFSDAAGELCAHVNGTQLALGFNPLIVDVPQVATGSPSCASWRTTRDIYVDTFAVQLEDAGGDGSQWTISLYSVTLAEFDANTYLGGSQLATHVFTMTGDHVPTNRTITLGTPAEVNAGRILAVLVENAPLQFGPPAKEPGRGLSIAVGWRNRV